MAEITQDISLRIKLDDLKTELAKIPGLTEQNIKKAASAMSKEWRKAEKDAEKLGSAVEDAFKGAKPQIDGLGKAVDKLGFGPVVNDLKDLSEGLIAIGPAAGAVLVAGAAFAGLATAAAGAVVGVVALVAATEDLAKSVEHVAGIDGLGIDQAKLDRVRDATAGMEALRTVAALVDDGAIERSTAGQMVRALGRMTGRLAEWHVETLVALVEAGTIRLI